MEIITSTPPHSTKSPNKRKKTINWVLVSLSLTHRAWGGGGGVLYKNRTEMQIVLLYRGGGGGGGGGGRCPHSKGQMSIPLYKLDTIFLCRGQTTLAMRYMFPYLMKKVF